MEMLSDESFGAIEVPSVPCMCRGDQEPRLCLGCLARVWFEVALAERQERKAADARVAEMEADVSRLHRRYAAALRRAEKYDPADDEWDEAVECPRCGHAEEDLDGVGFVYCEACGFCTHPSLTGDKCDICGETTNGN